MNITDIEYGMLAVDKNGKTLGVINHIIMDSWTGEPRKFVVRLDDDVSALYFVSENVADISGDKVKLNITADEMEKT